MPFAPPPSPPASAWIEAPSPQEVVRASAFRNNAATALRIGLVCVVRADGRLDACRPEPPAPGDASGAIRAALWLAARYRLKPGAVEGPQVTLTVSLPRLYDLAPAPLDAPTPAALKARFPTASAGAVDVLCDVSPGGVASNCQAVDAPHLPDGEHEDVPDDPALRKAAVATASQVRFSPARLGAGAVASAARLKLDFSGHEIRNPDWLAKPSGADFSNLYPELAQRSGLSGWARVRCTVAAEGRLRDCVILAESPAGVGFGEATLAMTGKFRMKAKTQDGQPVDGGTVTIPVNWRTDARPQPNQAGGFRLLPWAPWITAPTPADMAAAYPKTAAAQGLEGRAALRCDLRGDGSLTGCEVASATPGPSGFGAAALRLAPLFRTDVSGVRRQVSSLKVAIAFDFSARTRDPAATVYVREPDWVAAPDARRVMAAFPEKAITDKVFSGSALVDCAIAADGALGACTPVSETPGGEGFGAAAVAVAGVMRANLWTRDGEPAAGRRVKVPMRFVYAGEPAAPPEVSPSTPAPAAPPPAPPPRP